MKLSKTLCLDHFYIMVSPEQFKELTTLEKSINGFIHKIVKVKGDSWEGAYLKTNSGEYIEFMLPEKGNYEGLGIAFSSKSPIFADTRKLKNEFKKMNWLEGTRIWGDGSKWFTWTSLKSKKNDQSLNPLFSSWAMFYHPRYHQYKSTPPESNKPNSMARILQLDILMNPRLLGFIKYHLKWSSAVITSTKKGIKIEIPNREFETFTINITLEESCEKFMFKKIVMETQRMKKVRLPKLKTVKLTQKNGVVTIKNALTLKKFENQ